LITAALFKPTARFPPGGSCHVDDSPPAGFEHMGHDLSCHAQIAKQFTLQHLIPLRIVDIGKSCARNTSCIVD
jgi:hypothetical protein